MEILRVKLKTLEQLIQEFGFEPNIGGYYCTSFRKDKWNINPAMIDLLGKHINVIHERQGYYTHRVINRLDDKYHGWYFHELWFDDDDFIEENEFML